MVGSSSDCRLNSRNVSDRAGACPSGVQLAIVGQAVAGDAVLTAKNNGTLTELKVRPVSAVTLGAAIPPATSALFGAKPNAPFDTMRTLFGWPERPGLYRDLLRTRRLGLSTACLRDVDGDGRFDEGRRFDFNSGFGDLLGITPSGKIIGVRTTAKRLPVLCRSRSPTLSATSPGEVTGRLALMWRKVNLREIAAPQIWLRTPDNYTGTKGCPNRSPSFPSHASLSTSSFTASSCESLASTKKVQCATK